MYSLTNIEIAYDMRKRQPNIFLLYFVWFPCISSLCDVTIILTDYFVENPIWYWAFPKIISNPFC